MTFYCYCLFSLTRLWRSTTGLDDAGMDLRVAQFSAHTSREFDSATTPAGLEQQLPLLVALCAIAGAILFAFLVNQCSIHHLL